MAEPKTQVERRLDRQEEAIRAIAQRLFVPVEVEEIERILRGEKSEELKEDASS